jgi:hypothetical protein
MKLFESPLHWPVPEDVRIASKQEMQIINEEAILQGYSRRADHLNFPDWVTNYVICPFLFESNPRPIWICHIAPVPNYLGGLAKEAIASQIRRADVSTDYFSKLRKPRKRERNLIVHSLIWLASRNSLSED